MGVESAHVPVETVDGQEFLVAHALEEIGDIAIEAHGGSYTVSQALSECPPFAKMITSLSASLESVPGREEILKTAILSASAPATEIPADAKKKLM